MSDLARDAKSTNVVRARALCLSTIALVVVSAGCATQADIQELRREQRALRSQLADTRATLDAVQRDIGAVRGKVDEVRHAGRGESDIAKLDSLEARIAALEQRRPAEVVPEAAGAPSTSGQPAEAARAGPAASDLGREEAQQIPDEYRRGLSLVRQGAYDRAIQAFRDFLRANADSPSAPNAHYWIGESYYLLGDYSQAILKFNDVRQQYPKSDRAAPALLKIGLAFLQMGNKNEARLAFQKVLNDYPSSPEAAQAREKLQALGA